MSQCGGWRQIMPEYHGFFKKVWLLILIAALSIFYFLYAIIVGPCQWLKEKFK